MGPLGAAALLAALLSPSALALNPDKLVTQYMHDVWQTERGLPNNTVQAILQTRDGYLWLGTQEGLVRFDGVRFTVFDRQNTKELGSSSVLALREDREGQLWIGTNGGGLIRLSGGQFTRFRSNDVLAGDNVSALAEDRRSRFWVGSLWGGVARFEDGRFVPEPALSSLPSKRVRALLVDREGALWIATSAGLGRLKDGVLRVFTTSDGLSRNDIYSLSEDRKGSLWIGTWGGGLDRLENGTFTALTTREGLSNDSVRSILEDRDGNVWVGTDGGGLNRMVHGERGSLAAMTTREGLSTGIVWSLHEDREGSLWIGTLGGGLNRLRDGKVTVFTIREGLTNDGALTIREDREGSLWIGTNGGGLNRLVRPEGFPKDGRVTVLSTRDGLSNDVVLSLGEGRDGSLWIGTRGGGLGRLKDGRLTTLTTRDGLSSDIVWALCEDREGTLWIGTLGQGVDLLRDGKITRLTTRDGLSNDSVRAIVEDREGTMWIGTDAGLSRLARGEQKPTVFRLGEGLAGNTVESLHEDGEGALWIGTGAGIHRLKNGRFTSLTARQGLFDDDAFAILEDDLGHLWISGNKGIHRVVKREAEEVLDRKRATVTSVQYGTADGMKSPECNGGTQPAGWKTRDGRIWFPTIRGVVLVNPAHLPTNTLRPPVLVEEVLVDGRLAAGGATLRVPPGSHTLELRYTALSLVAGERVRFKYRLEGFDPEWVDAGTRRTAYFTNLGHGSYRFQVIACNDDGVWNQEGASLPFVVEARLAQKRWFQVLLALLLGGALYGAYRVRVWRLKTREKELMALVEERTSRLRDEVQRTESALEKAEEANRAKSVFLANMSHELRTPLNAVLGFAQLMRRRKGRDAEDLEQLGIIGRGGEHLLGLINDVLSLSKIEAGAVTLSSQTFEPISLLSGLVDMLRGRAEGKDLELAFEAAPGFPGHVVSDESKLRQILINILGNAVKFTKKGRVVLRASWKEGKARFDIQDTGPGMTGDELAQLFAPFVQTTTGEKAKEGTGLGLAISRSFARLMGGDITVESVPGTGTTFTVTLDLPAAPAADGVRVRGDRRRVIGLAPGSPAFRILVADDVSDNRLLLSRLLTLVGFEVQEAVNGEQALTRWRSFRPHLVFMDVRMPVLDGLQATRRIREEEKASSVRDADRVRIVGLSASAFEHERESILAAGCDDFLGKPFREGSLFAKLGELLPLRYLYEESAVPAPEAPARILDRDRLRGALPADSLRALRAAAEGGDREEAYRVAHRIRDFDAPLAEDLEKLIRAFRFDELLELLE